MSEDERELEEVMKREGEDGELESESNDHVRRRAKWAKTPSRGATRRRVAAVPFCANADACRRRCDDIGA